MPSSSSIRSARTCTRKCFCAPPRAIGRLGDPDDLVKFPADFYAAAGINPGDVIQTDGSGLSRHDLVTPRA